MLGDFLGTSFAYIVLHMKKCILKVQKYVNESYFQLYSLLTNNYKFSQRSLKYFGIFTLLKLSGFDTF